MKTSRFRERGLLVLAVVLLTVAGRRIASYCLQLEKILGPATATLPQAIHTLPGFKVELLHAAATNEGSWICMAADGRGRFLVSREQAGLLRLTVEGGKLKQIETIRPEVSSAMGLLCASNNLFIDCQGPAGWGVYRLKDNGGDFGPPKLICPLRFTESSHGAHAVLLGPDGKLYVVCGDHTKLPPDISPSSPLQNYGEDQLLPSDPDTTGWDLGVRAPEGYVLRMDMNGKNRELFAGGARNNYCAAFSPDGELFGFDNDHNNDDGTPWYRPIRINHWISGADFGCRQGTGKFPEYYEDTLPATLDVGLGAPSGVKFAPSNAAFPPPYRDACFMEDWLYGKLFAVHFTPHGATWSATMETVLQGTPLNLTSLEFGADGALYFITGGNGTPSGLYRLTYRGPGPPALAKTAAPEASARGLRRQLEQFQGRRDPAAADFLWPSLNSPDRWLRYAARAALEFQDIHSWRQRALDENSIDGGLTALLALARCDGPPSQAGLIAALEKYPFSTLNKEQTLLKLRVMELSFIRQGHPSAETAARAVTMLDPAYPSSDEYVNRELCQLLLYLGAPRAIEKTLTLLDAAPTEEEKIYYVMRLRTIADGWTILQRRRYFQWFKEERLHPKHPGAFLEYFRAQGQEYAESSAVKTFLEIFRKEAIATLTEKERGALWDLLPATSGAAAMPPAQKFIKAWTMADLEPDLGRLKTPRHIARGRNMFIQAGCVLCHQFEAVGGSFGPDLTTVGRRLAPRQVLESIIAPSKVIADQYRNILLTLRNGETLSGRVLDEDDGEILLLTEPVDLTRLSIAKTDIVTRKISNVSPMPEGLVNCLTEEDIWDLVGFLERGPRSIYTPNK